MTDRVSIQLTSGAFIYVNVGDATFTTTTALTTGIWYNIVFAQQQSNSSFFLKLDIRAMCLLHRFCTVLLINTMDNYFFYNCKHTCKY